MRSFPNTKIIGSDFQIQYMQKPTKRDADFIPIQRLIRAAVLKRAIWNLFFAQLFALFENAQKICFCNVIFFVQPSKDFASL